MHLLTLLKIFLAMMNITFDPFPALTTERLELKEITINDINAMYALRTDAKAMKYIPRPIAKTLQEVANLIDLIKNRKMSNDGINWGIFLKNESYLLGMIGYVNIIKESYRAEIGYMLNSNYHRRGIMQEAFTEVVKFGYDQMNLHSIEAVVHPGNIASASLLEKNNFTKDAYFKDYQFHNNEFIDAVVYSHIKGYSY